MITCRVKITIVHLKGNIHSVMIIPNFFSNISHIFSSIRRNFRPVPPGIHRKEAVSPSGTIRSRMLRKSSGSGAVNSISSPETGWGTRSFQA